MNSTHVRFLVILAVVFAALFLVKAVFLPNGL